MTEAETLKPCPFCGSRSSPGLLPAAKAIFADYQTSDNHHPDHVLIRRADFEALRAAIAKAEEAS